MIDLLTHPLTLFAAAADDCADKAGSFFGLRPWYYYLPDSKFDGCDVRNFTILPRGNESSDVPLVLLAVVDDLLRIVALVAIAFVLVGAIQMITSQGNPEDTSRARSTVINALLGLAIAIVAAGFVAFLGARLKG